MTTTKPESPLKAKLTITLKAGEVAVAESSDPILWQEVLAAISSGDVRSNDGAREPIGGKGGDSSVVQKKIGTLGGGSGVASLAKEIGVSVEALEGAIAPVTTAPFLHLDLHCWAAWAKNIPARGPNSVSPVALGATLLVLWFRKGNLGTCSVDQATAVLTNANVPVQNPTRSIRNCDWLQLRGNSEIVLNPARVADAIAVAKAFCSRRPREFAE